MHKIKAGNLWHSAIVMLALSVNSTSHAAGPFESDISQIRVASELAAAQEDETAGLFTVALPHLGQLIDIGFRGAEADGGRFAELTQRSLFADFKLPWSWSSWSGMYVETRLTGEIGEISNGEDSHLFGSLGPSVRLGSDGWRIPVSLDFGLSPTLIDGASYGDNDFGTSLNFTSHMALGLRFGRQGKNRISVRYQHISNGGINSTNPGVNMVGLDFVLWTR